MKKKHITHLIIVLLTIASLAAFGRIAGNEFINFDDQGYITENNHIQSGINSKSVKWAFTNVVLDNWVPLSIISHMLDWSLFGANATGHHIVSLLLHIGAVIFLFLFLNKTTNNIWPSAFAAAFFALHPMRVESVAWAAERKDVLSMFFGMATLYAYAFYCETQISNTKCIEICKSNNPAISGGYNTPPLGAKLESSSDNYRNCPRVHTRDAESHKLSRYFLCLILFLLSLLSKSMLVTLPFVFLLLDYWPLGRWQKENITPNKNILFNRLIGEKIPFLLLTIISSIITFLVQYKAGSVYPSLFVSISNAIVAYAAYLGKTFWPFDLALAYHVEYFFPAWQIIVSFLILTGITIVAISFIKKLPFLFVGWFWYLGTLFPVIGLVPISALIADHHTYLPSIGIAIMLAWGIASLIKNEETKIRISFTTGIVSLAVLSVLTWHQCGYWKNSFELWNHACLVTENNYLAYNNRGGAYANLGQHQRAIEDFNETIRLKPSDYFAYNNRGTSYFKLGQYQRAIEDYNKAIILKPDAASVYNHRGTVYAKLGQYQLAIEDHNKAIRLKNDYAEAYNNRAITYFKQGSNVSGCLDAQKACELGKCNLLDVVKIKGYCR